MALSNISRVEELLEPPSPEATLEDLAREMNELATLKQNTRLAFCKRLAIAYMMIVGRAYGTDAPKDGGTTKFIRWCDKNIKSANGKRYMQGTIRDYLTTGFASDPAAQLARRIQINERSSTHIRKLGIGIRDAIENPEPPKPIAKRTIQIKYHVGNDVSGEVNALMTAWERASIDARKLFIKLVT